MKSSAKSGQSQLLIPLLIIISSAIVFAANTALNSSVTEEFIFTVDVFANTYLGFDAEENVVKTYLFMDNGTAIANQKVDLYLDESFFGSNMTNEKGLAEFFVPEGEYEIKSIFEGNDSAYLNPSEIHLNFTSESSEMKSKKGEAISFDRDLDCQKCGNHKAPPVTNINMTISIESSEVVEDGVLIEYYPKSWEIVDANGGIESVYDSTYNKIEWFVGNVTDVSKSYIIKSPQRTTPSTKYYFQTQLDDMKSDWWMVIVSDPAPYPDYSDNSTNNTVAGQPTLFSLNWTDDVGLDYFIFKTNNTGTWVNETINFENQTGNVLFYDSFESGDFSEWTSSSGITVSSEQAHHGIYSAKITAWSDEAYNNEAFTSQNTVYGRAYLRFSSLPAEDEYTTIFWFYDDVSYNPHVRVRNNSGTYEWGIGWGGGSVNYYSSPSITTGVWYSVELKADRNNEARLYVDGTSVGTSPSAQDSSQSGFYLGGLDSGPDESNITLYVDSVVVSDSYIGPFNSWSNVTKTLNDTVGVNVQWCVEANDTSNNSNTTSCDTPFSLTTTETPLLIDFVDPTPPNNNITYNKFAYVNVSITSANNTSSFIDWNNSLVGYWAMDWYNSTGIYDNSSYNNFGTFSGTAFGTSNITTGKYGYGLDFDGAETSTDHLNAGNSASLNLSDTGTIEAWIYHKANGKYYYDHVIGKNDLGVGITR